MPLCSVAILSPSSIAPSATSIRRLSLCRRLDRTHGFPPRRLSFRRDPAPDHQSSSSLTSLLRRKSRRHRDQLERMPSRPPRIRGAMTSCRAWNFLTLRSLIFGLRRERSARSILPIFVRLLPRSASSDSAIRSLSAATMNSSTARRVWIKVWDHRIRRRRGISCADASNDVLEDSRVRSPRQHVRSQVANRCVEFAREAHDGGKAFRLPLAAWLLGAVETANAGVGLRPDARVVGPCSSAQCGRKGSDQVLLSGRLIANNDVGPRSPSAKLTGYLELARGAMIHLAHQPEALRVDEAACKLRWPSVRIPSAPPGSPRKST